MPIHHELHVAVIPPGVRVLIDGDGPGPRFVVTGDPSVMFLVAYCVGEDVERPVIAELLHHLGDGFPPQAVVPVVLRDSCVNGAQRNKL